MIVSHDGAVWLPRLLAELPGLTRHPDVVVGVDTGSTDGSASLLSASNAVDAVHQMGRDTGFGAAVQAGLQAAAKPPSSPVTGRARGDGIGRGDWIWLLHDDCLPAPDTLERLLEVARTAPDIAAVGCRVRAWPSGRRLLEVGVTITSTGHRETGVEPGEQDQGQHDEDRDVLAVSSAGMLVRRDVWEGLGGFDPALPLFRDDVDFGWRAASAGYRVVVAGRATLFHVEAASRGVRETTCTSRRPHRADRCAALFTVLANSRGAAVPVVYVRLLLGSLLRAVGYLLGKLPATAWDEMCAAASVLGRPWRVYAARARRRRRRTTGGVAGVRRLLPPWWTPYANGIDAVRGRFGEPARETATAVASSARRLRPSGAGATRHSSGGNSALAILARHPLLVVVTVLTAASVVASRGLWGGGFLQGGALLPAPDGAAAWWRLYAESSHAVGGGSTVDTAPYVAMLALGATVVLGKAWLLVDVLMLLAAPLAGASAWLAAGSLVRGTGTRMWVALTYGLIPILIGAVASGHLGTVVAAIVLPWVARSGCRLLATGPDGAWRSVFGTGLWLSVAVAFAPVGWAIAAALGTAAACWLLANDRPLRAAQWAVALAMPVALLLPWSWRVVTHPDLALTEAGLTAVPGASTDAWQLAFARVGAPGAAPWWVTGCLTLVAVLALLRRDTRTAVTAAWMLVVCGLAAAALLRRQTISLPLGGAEAYPWLGVPVVVASAGAIAAAGIAADGLRSFIGSGSFGWRQPAAALGVAAGTAAVVLGLGWDAGAASHGVLHRAVAVPVPAYMVEAMATSDERVLVLRTGGDSVRYQLLAGDGMRLGDDSVLSGGADRQLRAVISDVLSQSRPADVRRLGALGIGYVVLPSPQAATAVSRLDAVAGLTRTSSDRAVLSGWQVDAPLVSPAVLPVGPRRDGWLLLQSLLWLGAGVLAAPASRRPLPAQDVPA